MAEIIKPGFKERFLTMLFTGVRYLGLYPKTLGREIKLWVGDQSYSVVSC